MEKSILSGLEKETTGMYSIAKMFWKCNKMPFIVSLCAGFLVHFPLYSNGLLSPDAIWYSEEFIAGRWEISLGRWATWILDCMHGGVNSYILATFLTLVFFSIGGLLLNDLFEVKSIAARILVPICVVVSPLVAVTITNNFCTEAYALAFVLAVGAILLPLRKESLVSCIGGGICLTFALGIYQSNLGVAASLAIFALIFAIVKAPTDHKAHGKLLIHLSITGILGVGLYFIILKLFLFVFNISMASYSGANEVGISNILRNLPISISCAYQDFFTFFAGNDIMVNGYWVLPCYGMLFALFFCLLIQKLVKNRADFLSILCVVALLCILPLFCNISDVAAPQTGIRLSTSAGMHCVCPAMIAFCTRWTQPDQDTTQKNRGFRGIQRIAFCVGLLLAWNYTLTVSADAITMKNVTDQQIALANRIWVRIEENEDYLSDLRGLPILLAGIPQKGNYPVASKFADKTNEYAQLGMMWPTYDGSVNCWAQMLRQKLGLIYWACSAEQALGIFATDEFKQMPLFPAQDSIQMIDGVLVVKISEMSP